MCRGREKFPGFPYEIVICYDVSTQNAQDLLQTTYICVFLDRIMFTVSASVNSVHLKLPSLSVVYILGIIHSGMWNHNG